jgi:DNA-binding LacI/PurR family transcriptional regulator
MLRKRFHLKDEMTSSRKASVPGRASTSSQTEDSAKPEVPRHRLIYEELLGEIQSGMYKPGDRLPSEAVLCERFQASRITIAKAFQSLQRDHLVTRRPGSGTYVEEPVQQDSMQFGLLIPDLGTTDIFEPICQGIMRSPAAKSHSLTWGNSNGQNHDPTRAAEQLCQQYIAQKVAGVFFAPTEFSERREETNHRIASRLENAGIPLVLLDRCYEQYPSRSKFDLVGIDNQLAGHVLTKHLLQAGAKRIVFAMRCNSASTVEARAAGYREALYRWANRQHGAVISCDFDDPKSVRKMLDHEKPDGIVCANDITAAQLMRTLNTLGVRVPADIKMAGVDDVSYAKFLPTPLTTIRQDCAEIGAAAMALMLDRLQRPEQATKDIRVRTELIVRASSGEVSP